MKKIKKIISLVAAGIFVGNISAQNTAWSTSVGIGIGTTTVPTTLTTPNTPCSLHVVSTGLTHLRLERTGSGNQNNFLDFGFTGSPIVGVTLNPGSTIFRANGSSGNSDMAFFPKNTLLGLVIKGDGKIGLNGVASPAASLQINGDMILGSTNTGARWKHDPAMANSGNYYRIGCDDGSGVFKYPFSIQRQYGRVGIGTEDTYLDAQLHVIGSYGIHAGTNLPILALERRSAPNTPSMGKWIFTLTEDAINNTQAYLTFNSDQGDVLKLFPNADAKLGGKFTCKEIKVTNTPWADYVFDDTYKLMSIDSLENYVITNNHLPNVPTTDEIATSGNNIAETDKILLEKVEELSLYIIALNKRLAVLEAENKTLNEKSISK